MAPKSHKKKSKASSVGGSSSQPSRKAKQELTTFKMDEINEMAQYFQNLYGAGQYAKVYKGELYSEEIAIKVYTSDREHLAKNEIDALSNLASYPYIIPLRGVCVDQDNYYIVMKFVSRNLHQLLEATELMWPETLQILVQLAHAIKAIISEEYVIADIKPDNILIDEDYGVYLCDLGSARKGGRDLPTVNRLYTPKEVLVSGNGTLGTDIYSFGCIVLQMIMRYNDFAPRNLLIPLTAEVNNLVRMNTGKKNKKAPNSSNVSNPHVSVQARYLMAHHRHGHVVHKQLVQSGCDEDDAKVVTALGIDCTNEEVKQRPSIQDIISTLEQLKIKKMKS